MDMIELSIRALENGAANLLILLGEYKTELIFECVPTDALYGLLKSAIRAAGGVDSTAVFSNGAHKAYLTVKKQENSLFRVKIGRAHLDLSAKQFCYAVIRMFDAYTYHFSKDEYFKNWNVFPESDLARLKAAYHAL